MTNINGEMGDKMSQTVVGPNRRHFTARMFLDDISEAWSIPIEDLEIRHDVIISYGDLPQLSVRRQPGNISQPFGSPYV